MRPPRWQLTSACAGPPVEIFERTPKKDMSEPRRCSHATVWSAKAFAVALFALVAVALIDWRLERRYFELLDAEGRREFRSAQALRWSLFVVGVALGAFVALHAVHDAKGISYPCSAVTMACARCTVALFAGIVFAQIGDVSWRPTDLSQPERDLFRAIRRQRRRYLLAAVTIGVIALSLIRMPSEELAIIAEE